MEPDSDASSLAQWTWGTLLDALPIEDAAERRYIAVLGVSVGEATGLSVAALRVLKDLLLTEAPISVDDFDPLLAERIHQFLAEAGPEASLAQIATVASFVLAYHDLATGDGLPDANTIQALECLGFAPDLMGALETVAPLIQPINRPA